MAAPTKATHPGRTVVVFIVAILAVAGVTFLVDESPTPQLGLDLEGGTSITLTARTTDGTDVTPESLQTAVSIIRSRVDSAGVSESTTTTQGSNTIVVAVPGVNESELVDLVGTTAQLRFRQVCFIGSGVPPPPVTPTPSSTSTDASTDAPTDVPTGTPSTTDVPSSTPETSSSGTVTTPATETPSALGRFGASAGSLRELARALGATTTSPTSTTPTDDPTDAPTTGAPTSGAPTTGAPTATPSESPSTPAATPEEGCAAAAADAEALQAFTELDCSDPANISGGGVDTPDKPVAACQDDGISKYLLAPATVLGTDVSDATAGLPTGGVANWQVNLTFTSDGSTKFTQMSEELVGLPEAQAIQSPQPTSQFGIVLDGVVQSAPVMQSRIPGNTAQITGTFTQVEAQQLANVLKYGALPLAFETSDVSEITPTLGSASLRAGLIAGLIGLGLVLVYALLYYRGLGIVVVASLVVAAAFTYLAVVLLSDWISFTLTLAGIAGLIVAIGITADSFIIYFERIRDEVREGRTMRAAVEHGWTRARRTIISADFISLLSASVLYIVSIGNVRGFAFALGLSTVIDLVVVFFFTKPLMSWLANRGLFATGGRLSGIGHDHLGAAARRRGSSSSRVSGATFAEEI